MSAALPVRFARHGEIALITIDNPPVNALGQPVRQGLLEALTQAESAQGIRAAVLCGAGRTFIAGADIREFGQAPRTPYLPEVCTRLEASPLLIVAAMHGVTLGGGLEVALAAHYRIAQPGTRVGLPEVTLGLIPGAGGTQRLPRLIGTEKAIDLITKGRQVDTVEAQQLGILDRVVTGKPAEIGLTYTADLLKQNARRRPTGQLPAPASINWEGATEVVQRRARGQIAPVAALAALRACVELPIEDGLKEERRIFDTLMRSDQRHAMIHAFFAERAAANLPELKDVEAREIRSVGVVGGGTMGSGIATAVLLSGLPVKLVEMSDAACEAARDRIAFNLQGAVQRGKLTTSGLETALGEQLKLSRQFGDISDCDLVIEAVFEDMSVKTAVFERLDAVCKTQAILATNTSYLNVDEIAGATNRPDDVIGLHFFSPAHVMKLLEIVVPERASLQAVATGFQFAKRLGKRAVRAGVGEGFIGNRILAAYRTAADHIVLAGSTPEEVDEAMMAFGFAMGPYAVADLAGLDIGWANRKRLAPLRDPKERIASFPEKLCETGHLGQKSGAGYYTYGEGMTRAAANPDALAIIEAERRDRGIDACDISRGEITERIMAAMVNEAAKVIEEGIARRPLDVDVVMLSGYGFPRHHGGPCNWADLKGLSALFLEIERYAEEDGYFWRPAHLLVRLASQSSLFEDLNRESKSP